ncbi:MAG: response regulator receiver protein [Tractidigestivibacter sp.]|uniref:response regulator receiver protein n=1 Tax=Tractidigestivibacter sp. TaxID=2847320 RepID=UPI003D8B9A73
MSFDPRQEDYQRLALRFASQLDEQNPSDAAHAFSDFGRRYALERDKLPQTNSDRAFHLVVKATSDIDYELPFANSENAAKLVTHASKLLDEAISIDHNCYDAIRMKESRRVAGFEPYFQFLLAGAEDVRKGCEELRSKVGTSLSVERAALARDIAMRPYLRWMGSLAEESLICGRNRFTIKVGEKLLEADPADSADVRFTMALAYAKLEDEAGLDAFIARERAINPLRSFDDAWTQLARIALAYKRRDFPAAREQILQLVTTYNGFAAALIHQVEIPDGVFSRLDATPYSEDELLLALSEGTVLLQEGYGESGRGSLGTWLANTASELYPEAAREARELNTVFPNGPLGGDAQ